MAWLKFDVTTPEKPEVLAITVAMGWDDPDLTVGKLLKVWRWFDQHTIDGNAKGVTPALLDRLIGVTGLTQAIADSGWLEIHSGGLTLPNFETHNGKTAKDRALTASRVAKSKSNGKGNGASVSDALPREEKRREEKSNKTERERATRLPSDFSLPDDWSSFCQTERPDLDPAKTFDKFRDYWTAKAGKDGAKLDWLATWRNWVREERKQFHSPKQPTLQKTFAERDREAGWARWEEQTGRVHPDRAKAENGQVIDITPRTLEISQ